MKNEKLSFQIGILEKTIKEGVQNLTQMEHLAYKTFNTDLKSRLKFADNLLDWQRFGDKLTGSENFYNMKNIQALIGRKIISDGQLADEHFAASKSELQILMEKVYFPVIYCSEHMNYAYQQNHEEYAIKVETEKIHDKLLVEIVTLQAILKILGCDDTPGSKKTFHQKISEMQKNVISGLMQRLLN